MTFPDFSPAPNITEHHELYERENEAIDPTGVLWRALREQADWSGRTIVDLGCGTGFWLSRYAAGPDAAARVVGVEPDPGLLAGARRHAGGRIEVLAGSAERLPLPDDSVAVVHARFAYFFPPGCAAGLAEALRVLRPGGALVMIDNDWRHGEFADLLARSAWAAAQGAADSTDAWWRAAGARRTEVLSAWECRDPVELEAILRIEFPPHVVDDWLADHPGRRGLTYGYTLFTTVSEDHH